ncbi:alpha/beta family hydrolase [Engelhardtia mirabilis]|uniref:Alpha/beta hydrolase family protein n=1 Tax=Engelhardtia mirabilis TaxID=2528011 RepID=A0A518BHD9_9BACT|nr:Alpha/beta hydrolase family protein [Planctomycetes bacterium Pla133]QDV00728.1 Alpha/beta hydrolase family protein [Planctomycetes bacterium Pla86]
MAREELTIRVEQDPPGEVRAALDVEDDAGGPVVLLAHGAGLPHDAPFMERVAVGLASRGLPTLRFDYPYATRMHREGRRFPPNPMAKLLVAHGQVLAFLRERFPDRAVVLAGKSMGGRASSLLAAAGEECLGCAFLGYPLHPPRKPDKLRVDHFGELAVPCLFLQGDRDPLAGLELLREHLPSIPGPVTLEVIEGGDHSFELPKRMGRTPEAVQDELAERIARWVGLQSD